DNIGQVVIRGIEGGCVVVEAAVACRGHEEDPALPVRIDGVVKGLRELPATPTIISGNDIHAPVFHHRQIVQAGDRAVRRTGPARVEELAGHELDVPVDAGDPDAVVSHGTDRAGYVGAMLVVIHRVRVVIGEVEPVTVIDKAVAVVIDTVAVAVRRAEYIRGEVLVVVVDPRVDHADDDAAAASGDVPRLRRVDVRV